MAGRRRWSVVLGGAALAAAVGLAAVAARKAGRLGQGWKEYHPDESAVAQQRSRFEAARTAIVDVAKSAASFGAGTMSAVAGSARDRTSDLIGQRSADAGKSQSQSQGDDK